MKHGCVYARVSTSEKREPPSTPSVIKDLRRPASWDGVLLPTTLSLRTGPVKTCSGRASQV